MRDQATDKQLCLYNIKIKFASEDQLTLFRKNLSTLKERNQKLKEVKKETYRRHTGPPMPKKHPARVPNPIDFEDSSEYLLGNVE